MKCKDIRGLLPDYLAGELSAEALNAVESHLRECGECEREYAGISGMWDTLDALPDEHPSPELESRFRTMLAGYRTSEETTKTAPSSGRHTKETILHPRFLTRIAAAAVLVAAGFGAGRWTVPSPATRDIVNLQAEVSELKELVSASLVSRSSALERIESLSRVQQVNNPDAAFLSVLVNTLNTDPDVNVRLAAVNALEGFTDRDWVRAELVESLTLQTSPLVQVSLIEVLTELREQRAMEVFRVIADNEIYPDSVQKRARWGMQQLL